MRGKVKLVGLVGITSAGVGLSALVMNRTKISMAALSLSNIALIATSLAHRRQSGLKIGSSHQSLKRDLKDQKLLIKDIRNSEKLNHTRLEKKVSELSSQIGALAHSLGDISKTTQWAPTKLKSMLSSPSDTLPTSDAELASAFGNLTTRTAKAHPVRALGPGVHRRRKRVLFVSSNGAGLGHLTRISAVEKHLDADTLIYTMSSAYHRLGKPAKDVIYFPSHGDLGMDGRNWNVYQEAHFAAVVRGFSPDVIVFDGTYVYRGIIRVSRKFHIKLIWMQRGCWKVEIDQKSKQRHAADKICNAVIVPGDYGCVESVEVGEKFAANYAEPVTLTAREDLLDRDEARKLLGLPLDKKLFLVQLGAGVINDIEDLRTTVVRAVQELGSDWLPVLVRNPLSSHEDLSEVASIQAYPLGLYYNAFDAGAFAAGYNTVQESIELGLPGLFIPNLVTKTDDQLRRAQGISKAGLALTATELSEVKASVLKLGDDSVREALRKSMLDARRSSGAKTAADTIENLLEQWQS